MRSVRRALRELERLELGSKGEPPINLVPMIDIMVVLVLYLLVATLQKHLAVLELHLPTSAPIQSEETPKLLLSVTVRENELIVGDRYGAIRRIPNTSEAKDPSRYDLETLSLLLVDIKRKAPEDNVINLLLEPDIQYDVLIQLMDAVRLWPEGVPQEFGRDLFPEIALGDAPVVLEAPPAAGATR